MHPINVSLHTLIEENQRTRHICLHRFQFMILAPVNIRPSCLSSRIDDHIRLECVERLRNCRSICDIDAGGSGIRIDRKKVLAEVAFGAKYENLHTLSVQENDSRFLRSWKRKNHS